MLVRKLQTTYGRDNTKQAEIPYFHCGPSKPGKNFNQIRSWRNMEKQLTLKNK